MTTRLKMPADWPAALAIVRDPRNTRQWYIHPVKRRKGLDHDIAVATVRFVARGLWVAHTTEFDTLTADDSEGVLACFAQAWTAKHGQATPASEQSQGKGPTAMTADPTTDYATSPTWHVIDALNATKPFLPGAGDRGHPVHTADDQPGVALAKVDRAIKTLTSAMLFPTTDGLLMLQARMVDLTNHLLTVGNACRAAEAAITRLDPETAAARGLDQITDDELDGVLSVVRQAVNVFDTLAADSAGQGPLGIILLALKDAAAVADTIADKGTKERLADAIQFITGKRP